MSEALYSLGARLCRVSFFGMKWSIPSAEPAIDRFIQHYRDAMGLEIPHQCNIFDYGFRFATLDLLLVRFSDEQYRAGRFTEGSVHAMCNFTSFGAIECRPRLDP